MTTLDSEGRNCKKRLLMVFPLDMAAHYLRCLELCKKLRDQFEISFAYSPTYEKFVKGCGFETFKVDNFDTEKITASASRFDFSWLNIPNIEHVLSSQIKAIGEHKPSLVLGDAAFTLKMAAEKTGVPFVSLLNGYMTRYCRVTRQVSPSHPGYPYSKTMPKRVFERLTRIIEHVMFERIHAPFRRVRKKFHLSELDYFLEELEGNFNLICDLPSFFPQKRLPENYEYIGPLFYRGNEEEKEIVDFFGNGHHLNILVSVGSTGNWKNLGLLLDPVFSNSKIVISGNPNNPIRSDNILNKPFVNHTAIMHKVDILICHGGNGTTYQALSYGVPLLLFQGNFEQDWNIQRVVEMGLGARLEDSFNALDVRELVDSWVTKKQDASFREVQQNISSFGNKHVNLTISSLPIIA